MTERKSQYFFEKILVYDKFLFVELIIMIVIYRNAVAFRKSRYYRLLAKLNLKIQLCLELENSNESLSKKLA